MNPWLGSRDSGPRFGFEDSGLQAGKDGKSLKLQGLGFRV